MSEWKKIDFYIESFTKGVTPKYVDESETIVLNQKCIRNNRIDYSLAQYIDDNQSVRDDKYLQVGDVLINSTGQGTAGRVAFVDKLPNVKVAVDSHILILRCKDYITANLIRYTLYSFESTLMTFIDGSSGQGEFDRIRLFGTMIKLPSNNKDSIVKMLHNIDSKIELNNRIISELEAMSKQLYDYWFVQFDFPNAEGKPYRSSGGKMVYNDKLKREIPEGWEVKSLDSVATIVGGSTPSTEEPLYFSKSGTSWITPKDLSENKSYKYIDFGQTQVSESGMKAASLKLMPEGTVLMSSRAPVGYLAVALNDVTSNQGLKSFVPDKGYNSDFLFYTIQRIMPIIESKACGSTFAEVSVSDLKLVLWYYPGTDLSDEFERKIRAISERQKKLQEEIKHITTLRDWLLPMLMNGQITVKTI